MGSSRKTRRHSRSVLKGLAAGAIAGLAAAWTMNQYQKAWSAASGALGSSTHGKSDKASERPPYAAYSGTQPLRVRCGIPKEQPANDVENHENSYDRNGEPSGVHC